MLSAESKLERDTNELPVSTGKPAGSLNPLRLIVPAPAAQPVEPSVAILLCLYQGKHYLEDQLESIAKQTHTNWKLYISDDGDCEKSMEMIRSFTKRIESGRITLIGGPKKGFVDNFLSLTCNPEIDADYFAYSDQDDIWHSDKLEKSIQRLREFDEDTPSLYCSRTVIVDQDDVEIGMSPLFAKSPSFVNALVQNIGGGNTMLFNRKARAIALQVGSRIPVITHDWWMYLLITGVDGNVIYDPAPSLRYRQHSANLVGCNITWSARVYRIYLLLRGRFKDYNERNERSLLTAYHLLTPNNQQILDAFSEMRKSSLIRRIKMFKELKIYRQTLFGSLGIWVAVILNKL